MFSLCRSTLIRRDFLYMRLLKRSSIHTIPHGSRLIPHSSPSLPPILPITPIIPIAPTNNITSTHPSQLIYLTG